MTPTESLQAVLAGEHAATYVDGALGGRLAAFETKLARTTRAAIRATYDAHITRRDDLTDRIRDLGADPVAAEPAYELPGPATNVGEIRATALLVERRCQDLYAQAVGMNTKADRDWAFDALSASAALALALGAAPEVLPAY